MASVKGFKGIRYNNEKLDLSLVTAPPYDVISDAERDEFERQHENNVVKLILGKINESDSDTDNRYTRAKNTLDEWLSEKVFIQEDKEAYYLLKQEYKNKYGEEKTTLGFIAALKLHPWSEGVVLPHERTLSKPKADRLKLVKETKANLSPIYVTYEDEGERVEKYLEEYTQKHEPFASFEDSYSVINKIWIMPASENAFVENAFKEKTLYIADGHHRYETMVAYRDYRREKERSSEGEHQYDYAMVYFTGSSEKRLTVYPTHRLIFDMDEKLLDELPQKLSETFHIDKILIGDDAYGARDTLLSEMKNDYNKHSFGYYRKGTNEYIRFTLKDQSIIDSQMAAESPVVRNLDVSILHTLVLEKLLGLDKEKQAAQTNLKYTRDDDYAVSAVKDEDYQAVFFLNSTPLRSIIDVSDEGSIMPQKSTYFYPKLPSGIVFRVMK